MREDAIVAEARRWIGTPYVHQASVRGAGSDCLGLLRGVWRGLYGCEPCALPAYTPDWSEPQRYEVLWRGLAELMSAKPLEDEAPGDVILFRMRDRGVAKHLGLQTRIGAEARFLHAYSGHAVVETALSVPWQRRIVARFAFPDIQEG
ncbi:MAG: peptidase [Marivita sp.]|uniref:peptidase n=1 Tax=Marivita sp. TaxID=2003365 RepID=UPI001B113F40|nr:peptidase [Marivita sp.]MBO6883556.1 peptidase [Marivita sp.]